MDPCDIYCKFFLFGIAGGLCSCFLLDNFLPMVAVVFALGVLAAVTDKFTKM